MESAEETKGSFALSLGQMVYPLDKKALVSKTHSDIQAIHIYEASFSVRLLFTDMVQETMTILIGSGWCAGSGLGGG